ncbi:MAG: RHS repeat-associated core domain-containing protein, partial [bacterium]
LQGAGGIGGLLARVEGGTNYCYTFDGNGNVADVVADGGATVAHYEYDPFGRTVAQSGAYADANPWRFSTKQLDEWGLYYYGLRFYNPGLGRWGSRDPLIEAARLSNDESTRQKALWLMSRRQLVSELTEGALMLQPHLWALTKLWPSLLAAVVERVDSDPSVIPNDAIRPEHSYPFVQNAPIGLVDADGLAVADPNGPDWEKFLEELKKKIGEKAWNRLISELDGSLADAKRDCDHMKCKDPAPPRNENWVLTCYSCSVWECIMKRPQNTLAATICLEAYYLKCLARVAPWEPTIPVPKGEIPKKPDGTY